jgi:dihydrofolate reductase
MRRFKLQVQTTVDGYMAGPDGEMDWMTVPWSVDVGSHINGLMRPVDTIVLGRKLAEGFIPAWAAGPPGESPEAVDFMNNTPKVVYSNRLTESPWPNTVVVGGDLTDVFTDIKAKPGGDMIAYGGSRFVSALIAGQLLDEIHLFVNPTAIGAGLPVFADLGMQQRLRLISVHPFACGIMAVQYEPVR